MVASTPMVAAVSANCHGTDLVAVDRFQYRSSMRMEITAGAATTRLCDQAGNEV